MSAPRSATRHGALQAAVGGDFGLGRGLLRLQQRQRLLFHRHQLGHQAVDVQASRDPWWSGRGEEVVGEDGDGHGRCSEAVLRVNGRQRKSEAPAAGWSVATKYRTNCRWGETPSPENKKRPQIHYHICGPGKRQAGLSGFDLAREGPETGSIDSAMRMTSSDGELADEVFPVELSTTRTTVEPVELSTENCNAFAFRLNVALQQLGGFCTCCVEGALAALLLLDVCGVASGWGTAAAGGAPPPTGGRTGEPCPRVRR